MEHDSHPHGGDHESSPVNSYGTDDPAAQARIEAARRAAAIERRQQRERFDQLAATGMNLEDASSVVEFEGDRDTPTVPPDPETPAPPETDQPRYQPRIYVADEASLERGIQHGLWIDADQDPDDIDADIAAMLDSSPTVGAADWRIRASSGFAGIPVEETTSSEVIACLGKGVTEHGEAFAAYADWVGPTDLEALGQFRHHYMGTYPTLADWGKSSADVLDWPKQISEKLDSELASYVRIDHASFARDTANWWHIVHGDDGIHIFAP